MTLAQADGPREGHTVVESMTVFDHLRLLLLSEVDCLRLFIRSGADAEESSDAHLTEGIGKSTEGR